MKICIFGDSKCAPDHIYRAAKHNPDIDVERDSHKLWFNLLKNDGYDVTVMARCGRDNCWIDEKIKENYGKFDKYIVRAASPVRPECRLGDENFQRFCEEVLHDFAPDNGMLVSKYIDQEHEIVKAYAYYYKYIFNRPAIVERYENFIKKWSALPNTLVLKAGINDNEEFGKDVYHGRATDNLYSSEFKEFQKWVRSQGLVRNGPPDPLDTMPFINKYPNHFSFENHDLIYKMVKKWIETGTIDLPIPFVHCGYFDPDHIITKTYLEKYFT